MTAKPASERIFRSRALSADSGSRAARSGLVVAVHDLLDRRPRPSDLEVREALSGNLCRCTGYTKIIEAVLAAAGSR